MKINQGDYLILNVGNKPMLAHCTHAEDKEYSAVLERSKEKGEKLETVDFKFSDVIANLGKRPRNGSVHGVKIEPLVQRLESPSKMWTEIRLYQFLDKAQQKALLQEIESTTKTLRQYGLGTLRCELEIRQVSGKYSGLYKFRPKAETDILCIKPEDNLEGFKYIMAHEAGHGMWYRMITAKTRVRWIQLYHEYITSQEVLQEDLQAILEEIQAASSIRDYLKDADDDSAIIVKDALRHIQRVHSLNKLHLELALNNGEDISNYWPTALELSTKETAITEYGMKNPEEFFAESFAFHVCGRKIPRKIQALLDTTLSKLKKA